MTRTQATLPNGWTWAQIGDTGRYINGFAFKPEHWGPEGRPIIRIQNLTDPTKEFNRTTFNPPDNVRVEPREILISWSATLDAFIWKGEPALLNQHIFRVVPEEALISAKFLFYLLKESIWEMNQSEHLHGSTMRHINRGPFMKFEVPIPPRNEQQRIVAEIEKQFTRLEAALGALKRVQGNLRRYRAAVLKAAVEGRLVPTEAELAPAEGRSYEPASELIQRILAERRARWEAAQLAKFRASGKPPKDNGWKSKYQEPREPESAGLPEIPGGWKWVTMPQLGELNRGKSKHRPRDDAKLYGGPYPFIQTGDVKRSGGYIRDHSQTYSETGLAQSRLWPPGTLCITIAANIAESGILTYAACFPDSVVGLVSENLPETIKFVQFFLETAKADLARFAPATAQKNINLEVLSHLAIPLPPLDEQRRIVAEVERRLSVTDEIEMEVEIDLKRSERLRQAILKSAFQGNLVAQDPSDEPASVLLERIRAEREAKKLAAGTKKGSQAKSANAVTAAEG